MISLLGAIPVFVDIEEDTYNINASEIEGKITDRTKAIMPVSLYGQTADMDMINDIASRNNLIVIEDAAQSFGATYKGKKSCNLSHLVVLVFFHLNPWVVMEMVVHYLRVMMILQQSKAIFAHGSKKRYVHEVIGVNGRMDTIQAAVVDVKLEILC